MAEGMIRITMEGKTTEVPAGTTYGSIVRDWRSPEGYPALLVLANGRLRELHKIANRDYTIVPVSAADRSGMDTYKRSLCLLFLKAVYDTLENHSDIHAILRFTNSNGYYFTLNRGTDRKETVPVTAEFAASVKKQMQELTERALPVHKRSVSTWRAREFFRAVGMTDKDELFRYRIGSQINLYSLENYQDYFYGYMVSNTKYLKYFDVVPYADGIVLVIPDADDYTHVTPFHAYRKIFEVQQRSEDWAGTLGISSVADLNNYIRDGKIGHELLVAEALQESNIAELAAKIRDRGNTKFVMIAGPSSSGKTTFSRRLSIQLSAHGMTPHPISLDNFYLDRARCPKDENGDYDFESLDSLDVPLIKKTLKDLIDGKEAELPRFNFITGKPEYHGDRLKLGRDDILVIEGIHGLNDRLTEELPKDSIFRIYISALTQLNVDEHNHISTTDGRLIRRIVRDNLTRGTSAQETINRWPSVRAGERKNIFPHQENADAVFNSALIYELSVLKVYAEPLLFQVPDDAPEYLEAKRLLKFLSYFVGTPSDDVPRNSILREFIGGSCFDVY
ncbi:MAG: nucleoside kinase [Eubacteriales bacterium]|jgi:uridine kinase